MNVITWFSNHPKAIVEATLLTKAVWDTMIGALPAPTKDSSAFYTYLFKVLNSLAFNFHRAASTAIENSPNFLPAVEKYIAQLGTEQIAKIARGGAAPPLPLQ